MLRIAGTLQDGKPLAVVDVPVRDFTGRWWLTYWGADAVVEPLKGIFLIGAAMQELSRADGRYQTAACTRTPAGVVSMAKWCSCTAAALSVPVPVDGIETRLSGSLAKFELEPVADIQQAVGHPADV